MKYLDEYRDADLARQWVRKIEETITKPWTLMEVCGGQTHSIIRYGIDQLLPESITLLHGPGCPVCVTPLEMIDRAHAIAQRSNVILCSFGDMLRVPGSTCDLLSLKSQGADVRIVYSPLDAVQLAAENPDKEVVFFAVGFETTAPANAMAVSVASRKGLGNFSVLVSHVLVPPAIVAILNSPDNRVQAFLGPGHVCTVMGVQEYQPIVDRYRVPIVITGFEPVDLLRGIHSAIEMLESGEASVKNAYGRAVRSQGNASAKTLLSDVFEVTSRNWRGVGNIANSGFSLRKAYSAFDAEQRFDVGSIKTDEPSVCISGEVLRGVKRPDECPAYGKECTPETPLGATMVSSEGACAAYFNYRPVAIRPKPANSHSDVV